MLATFFASKVNWPKPLLATKKRLRSIAATKRPPPRSGERHPGLRSVKGRLRRHRRSRISVARSYGPLCGIGSSGRRRRMPVANRLFDGALGLLTLSAREYLTPDP
jgi:hypothetical protein